MRWECGIVAIAVIAAMNTGDAGCTISGSGAVRSRVCDVDTRSHALFGREVLALA